MGYISASLGGLGLFLLGMWLITEGLRVAAGPSLERLLSSWTSSRWRGLVSGTLLTVMVQSSSAVTVAALGFVNTGLLRFERAVWVIFGSNLGTTLTAWLVAMIGFSFKIDLFALPIIGVGALLRVFAPFDRYRSLGMALAGFGLLFMGIQVLSSGFGQMGERLSLGMAGQPLVLMVGIGVLLTTLMQSSSAALAVVLTALAGGVIDFGGAAALVIGANVGTTSTALLSTLGATVQARRLAVAHVLFNLLTALVALALLGPGVDLVVAVASGWGLAPPGQLALFHTAFNALGIVLMWPLEPVLTRFLLTRFKERQRATAQLQFLDRNVADLPDAARTALAREIERILARYPDALGGLPRPHDERLKGIAERRQLLAGLGDFLAMAGRQQLTEEQVNGFRIGWRIQLNLSNMEDALAGMNEHGRQMIRQPDHEVAMAVLAAWFEQMHQQLRRGGDPTEPLRFAYEQVKDALMQRAMDGALTRYTLDLALQDLSLSRRFLEQWWRATVHLRALLDDPEQQAPLP
ncbi:Na/Pi cotransporter family protein [Alloalcanivorax xenomutans]|uniref:Na/Pi symporter n=1 Tax=Alloalcanivorax xenomutans TaxID=1094342 RepID=A0A9Q3W8N6_9GAMM|nr:Na/Pi symporter [Alloalcanivorax xenomutans]ARB46618.1 hypothetical protein P40_15380 [Alloalcanivorax xenomutans]MCE7510559.1 Na/Pi symporter [Alloalcanivorax xenomutans]WOA30348.1 Na/Pi symporter [Alloalcanivorax xenomutans]WOD27236.1 Na/Pi symporter [Alloalcanivorax xenomutans]